MSQLACPRRALLVLALLLGAAASAAHAQTSIELKGAGRPAAPEAPLRLADVARLAGPDAEWLGRVEIPLPPSSRGFAELSTADVRAALTAHGVAMGTVTISGSTCTVGSAAGPAAAPDLAPAPASAEPPAAAPTLPTIRDAVHRRLADLYAVDPADLRLSISESDAEFVDRALDPAARVELQPVGTGTSGRLPVRVLVYRGTAESARLAESRTVTVAPTLRRQVAIAAGPIDRKEIIGPGSFLIEERWVGPSSKAPAPAAAVSGSEAVRRIAAGAVIGAGDIATPIAVRRGQTLWVHCLSGSVGVRVRARALSDGREGEEVPFRVEGSKESFRARVSQGRAVMLASPAPA
ncbi:MAG TPA: flagellar basal body P-ring formation chaperone FlgA, partial [Phycisphaerales bacterium]|nr:flagellar basal body P-ring formation chaperone FlgA [Phycisphaerales bacterium]